jgi:OmpA-OmpF porin, OOP family
MKTWLIGIVVLLLWSAGSTYWYVCRVKGLCWEMNAGNEAIGLGNAILDSAAVAADPATAGSSAAPQPDAPSDPTAQAPGSETTEPATAAAPPQARSARLQAPYTVLFAFAGPLPENPAAFEQYLAELTAYLLAHPNQKALLRGYTDDTAARENNIKLSQRRCDVIAAQLRTHGLPDNQIVTEPLGEADPVATNDTQEGRRLNRRVVISIQE